MWLEQRILLGGELQKGETALELMGGRGDGMEALTARIRNLIFFKIYPHHACCSEDTVLGVYMPRILIHKTARLLL